MLEWYEAYTDYNYQMTQFEDLVSHLAKTVTGSTKVMYQGKEIDFTTPWKRLSVYDGVREYAKIDPAKASAEELFRRAKSLEANLRKCRRTASWLWNFFDLAVEEHIWHPTFIMDFPVEVSPLTASTGRFRVWWNAEPCARAWKSKLHGTQRPRRPGGSAKEQEERRVVDEAQPMDKDFCTPSTWACRPRAASASVSSAS